MKPQDDHSKSSRRQFVKIAAATLVAAPVISSLSSCTQQSAPTTPGAPTPGPSPTLAKSDNIRSGNRPPVIIDGGSIHLSSEAKLKRSSKPGPSERPFRFEQDDKDGDYKPVYSHAEQVRITNDYGELFYDSCPFRDTKLEVKVWLETVDDFKDGNVTYKGSIPTEPQFKFIDEPRGAEPSFVIEFADELDSSDDHFKGLRNRPKYQEKTIPGASKGFRIKKVEVILGGTSVFDSDKPVTPTNSCAETSPYPIKAEDGFRIIIWLQDAPLTESPKS